MASGADVAVRWTRGASVAAVLTGMVMLAATCMFIAAIPALYAEHLAPSQAVSLGLQQMGVSPQFYAAIWAAVLVSFAALSVGAGVVVLWSRRTEPVAWLVAVYLVLTGTVNGPTMEVLVRAHPGLTTVAAASNHLLVASLIAVMVLFPDGRAAPRLAPWVAVPVAVSLTVVGWGRVNNDLPDTYFLLFTVAILGGMAAQLYRYRRLSTWEQRQQTKWVATALVVAVVTQLALPAVQASPALSQAGPGAALGELGSLVGVTAGYATLVVAFAVAVLRHRLWDADVVVNRTLVYGGLIIAVTIPYVFAVIAAERMLDPAAESLVSLTLAATIALLLAHGRNLLQRAVNRALYGHRDEPFEVLSRLGRRLHDATDATAVSRAIVEILAAALRAPYVALVSDGRILATAGLNGQTDNGRPRPDLERIPLGRHEGPIAELLIARRSPGEPFNPADQTLIEEFGRQVAGPVAALQLGHQLQHAQQQRIVAIEEERRRLRRDLHDGLGPALASMALQTEVARDLLTQDPERSHEILHDVAQQLHNSTSDIRRLVYGLRPPALDDAGLVGALQRFINDAGAAGLIVRFNHPDPLPELSAAVEVATYRIAQEAITNVLRHAQARTCEVSLVLHGTALSITVQDDGLGIPAKAPTGVGLRSIHERTAELSGDCTISGGDECGTLVQVRFPHAVNRTA
ncbi:MAG: sensor histidine kinase [Acidimicrobiales bacterium]